MACRLRLKQIETCVEFVGQQSANPGKIGGDIFDAAGLKNVPKFTNSKALREMGEFTHPLKGLQGMPNTAKREHKVSRGT